MIIKDSQISRLENDIVGYGLFEFLSGDVEDALYIDRGRVGIL